MTDELDREYQEHIAAGRCPDCAMGLYPHYGQAPGSVCGFVKLVDAIHRGEVDHVYHIGFSEPAPREEWPANFHEDPECPGLGTWTCPRCTEAK